jgi:hypothetical protein
MNAARPPRTANAKMETSTTGKLILAEHAKQSLPKLMMPQAIQPNVAPANAPISANRSRRTMDSNVRCRRGRSTTEPSLHRLGRTRARLRRSTATPAATPTAHARGPLEAPPPPGCPGLPSPPRKRRRRRGLCGTTLGTINDQRHSDHEARDTPDDHCSRYRIAILAVRYAVAHGSVANVGHGKPTRRHESDADHHGGGAATLACRWRHRRGGQGRRGTRRRRR